MAKILITKTKVTKEIIEKDITPLELKRSIEVLNEFHKEDNIVFESEYIDETLK